mmetsp:Transcript_35350/g.75459  ORF Transcript_35350/g.75459 Transcript_35350/m.75459 type:complete len:326 (-) Transcript_35350:2443-3420(-)
MGMRVSSTCFLWAAFSLSDDATPPRPGLGGGSLQPPPPPEPPPPPSPTKNMSSSPVAVASDDRTAGLESFCILSASGSSDSSTVTPRPPPSDSLVPSMTLSTRRGMHSTASPRTLSSASDSSACRRSMMTLNQCSPSAAHSRSHCAATDSRTEATRSSDRLFATGRSLHWRRYTSMNVGELLGGSLRRERLPSLASPRKALGRCSARCHVSVIAAALSCGSGSVMLLSHMSTSHGTALLSNTSSAISCRTVAVDLRTATSTSCSARVMTPRSCSCRGKSRWDQRTGPREQAATRAEVDLDAARRWTTERNGFPAREASPPPLRED